LGSNQKLFDNFCYYTSTYGATTFTDREAKTFVHRNRSKKLYSELRVRAWHNPLNPLE